MPYKSARTVFSEEATVNAGVTSDPAFIHTARHVGMMVENSGANSVDIAIEVTSSSDRSPGANAADKWYPLSVRQADGTITKYEFAVAASGKIALDLSPVSFTGVRLVATPTVDGLQGEVTAVLSWAT